MTVPLRARVLLADDHALVRRGVRLILAGSGDLDVVAEAGDGIEAVSAALAEEVDLAVLDVAMPRMTGLAAAGEIARRRPAVRIVMLSMHDSEQYLYESLRAGASGYVLKSSVDRDLIEACRGVLRGEAFAYPGPMAALVREYLELVRRGEELPEEPLTPRELQVVKLVAESYSSEQIAAALTISPKTVERHRSNVLGKLGLRDRVQLTRYAIRRGLVEP